jgi:hypothetical protein
MYLDQWKALSAHILGLVQAGQLHARYLAIRDSDSFGRARSLGDQCSGIFTALEKFRNGFHSALPPIALAALDTFAANTGPLIQATDGSPDLRQERVWASLVKLAAFETEMSFLLSDVQQHIHARSELAFSHLQRLIVVDQEFRAKWKSALRDGEIACEKLGAVHLLLHGIWAFKVSAAGERTDLVFNEPAGDLSAEQRYVDGFVLTEWKTAVSDEVAEKRFAEARSQARRYAQGVLAGNELTAYRYAIVVSSQHITVPKDLAADGVVYRHVNIAVDPLPPSRG